ncbi:MAG: PilT/PilU family type 4a pilus ATPase [Xanthomonadales bacterium]|nr:PilT/PilU family type 4a pilus ATPase [Xanthomonadales bacterium]
MDIKSLLSEMVLRGGSDLYITRNSPPLIRADGVSHPVGNTNFNNTDTLALANALMSDAEKDHFAETKEMNMAIELNGIGRFRVNVHRQRDSVGIVIRHIKTEIPSLEQLRLPADLKEIVMRKRGLVLVTGATGSGKSTSLAAMLDYRNDNSCGHVVTVEDPIEFIHPNKKSIFTQREVGIDTLSFNHALKNALRQAPDVILIGEIRDRETMEAAITFADTGHLCLGTLHSSNAYQTLHRVLNFFPGEHHTDICLQLSMNLRAIVAQRLIPSLDGKRVVAVEIMRDTAYVKELIRNGEVDNIREGMLRGATGGCKTFDQSLLELYATGLISKEEAMANADYPNDLRLQLQQVTPAAANEPMETIDEPVSISARNKGNSLSASKLSLAPSWSDDDKTYSERAG